MSVKGRNRAEKDEGSAMDPDPGSQPGKRTLTMNPIAQKDGKEVLASAKPSVPPLSGSDVDIESQQPAYPTIDHDTRIAARPGTMGLWFEPKEGYVEFMERQARLGFTRKVLGIVIVQLLLTSVVGHYVAFEPVTRDYINGNPWITIFAMCLGISNLLVLAMFEGKYMQQYPTNYLLLLSFTLTQGFMVSLHPLSVHACVACNSLLTLRLPTHPTGGLRRSKLRRGRGVDCVGIDVRHGGCLLCVELFHYRNDAKLG